MSADTNGSLRGSSKQHHETYSKFNEVIKHAYNYKEVMGRQGLKQADVDLLYEKSKKSKLVPRFIHDKQVRIITIVINARTLIGTYF